VVLRLNDKKLIVAEVAELANVSISAVGVDYNGLAGNQVTDLRKKARAEGIELRVVRNTLARRAIVGTKFECMSNALVGPMLLGFCKDDPGAPARLMKAFAKDNNRLEVKVLSVGGQMYGSDALDRIASLPTKQQALGQLASVTQAPVSKLVRTFAETYAKVVRVINAVAEQKKAQ